ncbi:MAG: hypothetical protein RLZZ117_1009, partial [Cyanobacteriota bacterium]
MPGDRPRTTPLTPSRSPLRSSAVAAALPLLSLALAGQGKVVAAETTSAPESRSPVAASPQVALATSPRATSPAEPPASSPAEPPAFSDP